MVGCETAGVVNPPPTPSLEGGGFSALVAGEGDFLGYRLEHAVSVFEDVVVPETDHPVAVRFDRAGSRCVGVGGVLAAVAFDGQAQRSAGEIDDMLIYRKLPGEFDPTKLAAAQVRPQAAFRISHVISQPARCASQSLPRHRRTPIPNPFPRGKGLFVAKAA